LSSPKEWGFVKVGGRELERPIPSKQSHGRYIEQGAAGDSLSRSLLCRQIKILLALFRIKTATATSPFFSGTPYGTTNTLQHEMPAPDVSHPKKSPAHHKTKEIWFRLSCPERKGGCIQFLSLQNSCLRHSKPPHPEVAVATTVLKDAMTFFSSMKGKACGKSNTLIY